MIKDIKTKPKCTPTLICWSHSSYDLVAVLSDRTPEGDERPIAYVSWSLKVPETMYLLIDFESSLIPLVWGRKKFQAYFIPVTDHLH